MALLKHAVGAVPVDVGAALNLDGNRVLENIGGRPLRFVVAESAGEAAPTDLSAGQLLRPGQRELVGAVSGQPLWAWAPFPTRIGVGPAWLVAGAGGGGRTLGPQINTFGDDTTADRAAAEALRDAYAGANADWLAHYNNRLDFLILLRWDDSEVAQRRNVAGAAWEDVTDVIRGPAGIDGSNGAAGPGALISTGATYSAADNEIDLGLLSDPGIPSVTFWRVPADTDRKNAALSVRANSIVCPLLSTGGNALAARRLTPGFLLSSVYFAGECHLSEDLPSRPQDYRAVFVVGEDASDDDLVAADLATARAAVSPEDGGLIDVAAAFAAANVTSATTHRRYYWLGVPADAPDPSRLWIDGGARGADRFGSLETYAGGPDYGGAPYKWWRSPATSGFTASQRVQFLFEQGTY